MSSSRPERDVYVVVKTVKTIMEDGHDHETTILGMSSSSRSANVLALREFDNDDDDDLAMFNPQCAIVECEEEGGLIRIRSENDTGLSRQNIDVWVEGRTVGEGQPEMSDDEYRALIEKVEEGGGEAENDEDD
jgi:hypothetical protein